MLGDVAVERAINREQGSGGEIVEPELLRVSEAKQIKFRPLICAQFREISPGEFTPTGGQERAGRGRHFAGSRFGVRVSLLLPPDRSLSAMSGKENGVIGQGVDTLTDGFQ